MAALSARTSLTGPPLSTLNGTRRPSYDRALPAGASYGTSPIFSSPAIPIRPPLPSPPTTSPPTTPSPYEHLPTFVPAPAFSREDRGPYPPHRNSVSQRDFSEGILASPSTGVAVVGVEAAFDAKEVIGEDGMAGVGIRNSLLLKPMSSPPAQPPPHLVPQPEICVECMMRDRDMLDVDVTSPGVWDRDSDVDLDEWVAISSNGGMGGGSSEESGSRGGVVRRGGKGMALTAAALKTWTAMNPPASAHRWRTLQTFLAQQQHYLSLERAARQMSSSSSIHVPSPTSPAHSINPRSSTLMVERLPPDVEAEEPQRPWLASGPSPPSAARRQSNSDLRSLSPSRASFPSPPIRETEDRRASSSTSGWGRFRRSQGGASVYSFGAGSGSMLDMHLGLSQDLHAQMRGMGPGGRSVGGGVPYATYASLTRSEPFITGTGAADEPEAARQGKKRKGIKALFSKLIGRPPPPSSSTPRRGQHPTSTASLYNYPYPSFSHSPNNGYQNSDEALAPPPPISSLATGSPRGNWAHSRGFSRSTASFEPSIRSMPLPGRRRVSDDSGASPPRPGSSYFFAGNGGGSARSPAPSFFGVERDEEVLGISNSLSPGSAVRREKSLPSLPPEAKDVGEMYVGRIRDNTEKSVRGRKSKIFSKFFGSGHPSGGDGERVGVRY